jgi:hypothetical protein
MGRTNPPGGEYATTERGHSRLRTAGSGKGTGRTLTLEAAMAGVAVAAIAVFVIGVLIGAIATVAAAVRREDRALTDMEPDLLDRCARRLNGLGRRDPHVPPGGPLPH